MDPVAGHGVPHVFQHRAVAVEQSGLGFRGLVDRTHQFLDQTRQHAAFVRERPVQAIEFRAGRKTLGKSQFAGRFCRVQRAGCLQRLMGGQVLEHPVQAQPALLVLCQVAHLIQVRLVGVQVPLVPLQHHLHAPHLGGQVGTGSLQGWGMVGAQGFGLLQLLHGPFEPGQFNGHRRVDAGQGGNACQPVQKRGVQQPGARRKAFAWLCCKACQPGEVPGNVPGVRPAVFGLLAGFSQQLFRRPFRLPFGQCVRALWLGLGCVAFVSGPVCGEAMHGSLWA